MDKSLEHTGIVSDPYQAMQVVQRSILGLWDVVNDLTRLRPKRLPQYSVTIFGSARIEANSSEYEQVRRLAADLAKMGCRIVTGGGPGLMQAANEGAAMANPGAKDNSVGIRVDLPFEQGANAFVGQVYEHKTFFTRLHHFVMVSDAFICVSGGIGTVLELMIVWQLLQVRKLYDAPLVLVGEMWPGLVDWANKSMTEGKMKLASPQDMLIPICVDSTKAAIAVVKEDFDRWQQGAD